MRHIKAALLALLVWPCCAHAQEAFMILGKDVAPPSGYTEFCKRYAPECDTKPLEPRNMQVTYEVLAQFARANAVVNKRIKPMSDLDHWGVADQWDYPADGYGDCEDYVLQKRKELIERGLPRQALLITAVQIPWRKNEGHAVLTLATNIGDFVLDSLRDEVLLWSHTGYRFLKRQSQSDPNQWVRIIDPYHFTPGPFWFVSR